jgi:hypothetical protein
MGGSVKRPKFVCKKDNEGNTHCRATLIENGIKSVGYITLTKDKKLIDFPPREKMGYYRFPGMETPDEMLQRMRSKEKKREKLWKEIKVKK